MVYKKRSEKEIKAIIEDISKGMSTKEACKKYDLSDDSMYRLLQKHRGYDADGERRKANKSKIAKLEKQLKEKDLEIKLLKQALKKY